jgi:formate C-acetyltransferase
MKENFNEHPLTRMSLALEKILKNISIIIRPDELIVGCRTSKLKGAPLFPENKIRWLKKDVDRFDVREVQRALINNEEKQILKEEIIPFWEARTVEEQFESMLPKEVFDDMEKYVFTVMLQITYGIGHFTMNYERVLSKGLSGIIAEAKAVFHSLSVEDQKGEKAVFYNAVIRNLNAAIIFANRYADIAREMASKEGDPVRREELENISKICLRVPEYPANNFHEAVQCLYFIHLIAQIESGGNSISIGRIDQILYPYYRTDFEKGSINQDKARELISLLFLKTNEIWNVLEEDYIPGGEGAEGKTTQNVVVGGIDINGENAVNDLSYIALNAYADIRTVQPNFGVRISSKTDDHFFGKAVEYSKDGVLLHFFNDDVIVESLMDAGHSINDARNYGVVGCLEPNAQGKTFGSTFAAQFNGIKCLEFALSNGKDNVFDFQSGIKTGDPASFKDFESVWNAYERQVNYFIDQMIKAITFLDMAIASLVPSPFASAMIDGPLESGADLTKGGAVYNSTGVMLMGLSNIADSLYAIKKGVFEKGFCSMKQISEWLSDNWVNAEDKRLHFLNNIEKYGNDKDHADKMASKVLNHFCDTLSRYKNFRKGRFWPGVFSVGFHITMGAFTGATPDGRFAGSILGNGITPSNGVALSGPTGIMNSVTKLPLKRFYNGLNLNMRLNGRFVKSSALLALIKTYFKKGGMQVQFNMADNETLLNARKYPEQYRDLVVRISGYSATFVDLSKIAQDDIIKRMQYEL